MNPTPDPPPAETAAGLTPCRPPPCWTRQRSGRGASFEPSPPWLLTIRAFIALVIYGAVWLSVRGQHPYNHPTAAVIPVLVVLVAVNLVATVTVAKRATAGVRGRFRVRPAEIAAMAVVWLGVLVALGALAGAGVSHAIIYGIYPATAPLMAGGLAWAGIMAARANWRWSGAGLAVAAVGVVGVFAGPAGSWAVAGLGLFAVLLGTAAVIVWRQRRSVVRS